MTQLPVFITGNYDKVKHLTALLGVELEHVALDLDEIQSLDPEVVVAHKARQAYTSVKRPLLVDDVSMWLNALNGLPGPMIKLFVSAENGLENLCRMANGLSSRRATAQAYFGIFDGSEMKIMHGEIHGEIAEHPRGDGGFAYGWDKVFCPDGYGGRTRAELNPEEYESVYRSLRPIDALQNMLGKDE